MGSKCSVVWCLGYCYARADGERDIQVGRELFWRVGRNIVRNICVCMLCL